jgi:hypothetical protein
MLLQHNTFSLMPIVGIIGGGCSPASDILINLAEVMDVPLVSYSPGLTGQSSNHYHIYPTDESFVASLILLMEKFGWGRLTVFSEVDSYFLHVSICVIV